MPALLSTAVGLKEAAEVVLGVLVLVSVLPDGFFSDRGPAAKK